MRNGSNLRSHFKGLFQMVDTEAKQLQCILDLYRILRAQPKYRTLKEPSWKPTTQPVEVILWLLRKLGPLAKGAEWSVDTWPDNPERYRFVIWKHFSGYHVKLREEYLPLEFLPTLIKRDKPLHDLLIDLVALVSRENKVPLWDEDGDFSEQLKILRQMGPANVETLERQRLIYTKGVAHQYLRLIKARRKVVTVASILKCYHEYRPASERKRFLCWIMKKGIELAKTKKCIKDYSWVPAYSPGQPITPYQQYKFIWSAHHNDVLSRRAVSKMKKRADDGDYYPVMFSIAKPGQALLPLHGDAFPGQLYEFMSEMVKHFNWRHKDYYYHDAFKNTLTLSETLEGATAAVKAPTLLEQFQINDFLNDE
jgi:hypothetical protein